jgi:RNase H-like domain found in reverse transcriptase
VILYYIKDDNNGPIDYIDKGNRYRVQSILFFNKLLIEVESRYWFIELEVACLVWVVRKVRYIILGNKLGIIVYIDYLVIVAIAK